MFPSTFVVLMTDDDKNERKYARKTNSYAASV